MVKMMQRVGERSGRACAVFTAAVSAVLTLQSCSEASIEPDLPPVVNRDLTRGAALYAGSCGQFCHGSAPPGRPMQAALADPTAVMPELPALAARDRARHPRAQDAPDLFDCGWLASQTDGEIAAVIVAGIQGTRMVGFGQNFPEGQRDHARLIAYLRATAACEAEFPAEAE